MVRAGSLKYGSSSPLIKRLLLASGLIIIIVLVFVLGSKLLNGNSSEEQISKDATAKVSQEVLDEINNIGFGVFQPHAMLNNFLRTNVEIVDEARTRSDCQEVLQSYQGSKNTEIAFIDIYSYSSECPYPLPGDEVPYSIGDYSGWISYPNETDDGLIDSILIELIVQGSYVRIETDLPIETISEAIRVFVPFSPTPPEPSLAIVLP